MLYYIQSIATITTTTKKMHQERIVRLVGFNFGLEQWAIAEGLGLIPKDDPEICYHNFDPPRRG